MQASDEKIFLDKQRFHLLYYGHADLAGWFSRLERRPVTPEVEGSSPFPVAKSPIFWGIFCLHMFFTFSSVYVSISSIMSEMSDFNCKEWVI